MVSLIQHFEADFPHNLKVLNSGIILKFFSHVFFNLVVILFSRAEPFVQFDRGQYVEHFCKIIWNLGQRFPKENVNCQRMNHIGRRHIKMDHHEHLVQVS